MPIEFFFFFLKNKIKNSTLNTANCPRNSFFPYSIFFRGGGSTKERHETFWFSVEYRARAFYWFGGEDRSQNWEKRKKEKKKSAGKNTSESEPDATRDTASFQKASFYADLIRREKNTQALTSSEIIEREGNWGSGEVVEEGGQGGRRRRRRRSVCFLGVLLGSFCPAKAKGAQRLWGGVRTRPSVAADSGQRRAVSWVSAARRRDFYLLFFEGH